MNESIIDWLRRICADYKVEPIAVYRAGGKHPWPLKAKNEVDLRDQLDKGGHFLPLPKEPASLANVLEVAIVDYILRHLGDIPGCEGRRGSERGYPDIEISGEAFGGGFHAVDVKVARRAKSLKQTDSRITLYTGNTYFRYPKIKWPGTFRAFDDYQSHVDIIVIYTLNDQTHARVENMEVLVQEPWRIASRTRSSTTREYLGAVMKLDDLRSGNGEFESPEEFYKYWRKYPFRIGKAVQNYLDKFLAQ
jgi:hypothetical protein